MNHNATDNPNRELDELYREAGDVQPDPGIDRMIRARAEQAAERSQPRRTMWLGGLATASVAAVVLALTLRQAPGPESATPQTPSPDADSEASFGDHSRRMESRSARAAAPDIDSEFARLRPGEQADAIEAEPNDPPVDPDRTVAARARVGEADLEATQKEAFSPDALSDRLRRMIRAGQLDQARQLYREAAQLDPGLELPEDIGQALREADLEDPEPQPDSDPGSPGRGA